MDMNVSISTDINQLAEDWHTLDCAGAQKVRSGALKPIEYSFYQTYDWSQFVDSFNASHSFMRHTEYLAVRESDDELVAVLPVLVDRLGGKVEFPSWKTSGINQPSCAVTDPDRRRAIMEVLAKCVAERYAGLRCKFRDMPVDTGHYGFPEALAKESGLTLHERESYHIPLASFDNFDAYYLSLGKKFRHNIQTRSNHFTHGDLHWDLRIFQGGSEVSADYWLKLWRIFFNRKIAWKKRSRTFFRRLYASYEAKREVSSGLKTRSFGALSQSMLFVFEINGEPAAFTLLYRHDGCIVVPKLAIDSRFRAHAPGILMLKEIMRWCYDNGIRDFDLCRGNEPYKQEIGAVNAPIASLPGKFKKKQST